MTTPARRRLAMDMAEAASDLIESVDTEQRPKLLGTLGSDEQYEWFYTPTDHGGLALTEMDPAQHKLLFQLLATGLSRAGYATASAIMALENVLDMNEGWTANFPGRARGRDPLLYWIAIYGDPSSRDWAWRLGGHHLSLNYRISEGAVTGTTPNFFGANPADSPLLGPHMHRPLAGVEDLGRELAHALKQQEFQTALISPVAPVDIVGANRRIITDGDRPLGLESVFRYLSEQDTVLWAERQKDAEKNLGLEPEHLDGLAFSSTPKGLSVAAMSSDNKEIVRALLACYLGRLPEEFADEEMAKFAGDRIDSLAFAWAGGIEKHEPHYYRFQGRDLLVEYDNTQRGANHIHSVWRDLRTDFGGDTLLRHYANNDHH